MRWYHDRARRVGSVSDVLRNAVRRCGEGDLPANVALTHVFMAASDQEEARLALDQELERLRRRGDARGAQRVRNAVDLWTQLPEAFAATRDVLRLVDHDVVAMDRGQAVAHWSQAFDRIAGAAPDAGVALYALGDRDLLRAATCELVVRMREWHLLGTRAVLDLGCGSGRVLEMLAPEVQVGVGADVSLEMLRVARRRCASRHNVLLVRPSGRDLACFPDRAFDLVYAVDVFPYLVLAGLAERHLHEAARVLRPAGHLLLLNYSYRNDCELDRAEVARIARDAGLAVLRHGTRDLALWDGRAFLLQRAA